MSPRIRALAIKSQSMRNLLMKMNHSPELLRETAAIAVVTAEAEIGEDAVDSAVALVKLLRAATIDVAVRDKRVDAPAEVKIMVKGDLEDSVAVVEEAHASQEKAVLIGLRLELAVLHPKERALGA